jgi:phosphoglucomutase
MMTHTFHRLRHKGDKLSYIQYIGTVRVTHVKDISLGYDSRRGDLLQDKPISPSSEMITFELEDGTVLTLRGSGTEPKLKYYIEARGSSMSEAERHAEAVEKALQDVLKGFGLDS